MLCFSWSLKAQGVLLFPTSPTSLLPTLGWVRGGKGCCRLRGSISATGACRAPGATRGPPILRLFAVIYAALGLAHGGICVLLLLLLLFLPPRLPMN